jgi:uncharacterized protein (TIGR02246 family)
MRRTAAVLALAILAGCNKPAPPPPPPPGPPPIDEAAAKSGVEALWAKFITADTSGSFEAQQALFTDDFRLDVPAMPPVIGKAAWEAMAKPMIAARNVASFTPNPHTTWVINNDLVYQGGTFSGVYVETKKTRAEYGRFIAAIARGADGQWRFAYLMAIPDSTVAAR